MQPLFFFGGGDSSLLLPQRHVCHNTLQNPATLSPISPIAPLFLRFLLLMSCSEESAVWKERTSVLKACLSKIHLSAIIAGTNS